MALSGTGLNQPALAVLDADIPPDDLRLDFDPTLDDGAGGRSSTRMILLKDVGTQPLSIPQNGVATLGSEAPDRWGSLRSPPPYGPVVFVGWR